MVSEAISFTEGQVTGVYTTPVMSEDSKFFAEASMAENTKRAYRKALEGFAAWCHQRNLCALPADIITVSNYAAHMAAAGRKSSTIKLHLAAIREIHKWNQTPLDTRDTTYKRTLQGIWRTIGVAQHGRAPLEIDDLRLTVEALPENIWGIRNRAILLLGWAGAMRRSEIAGLDIDDLDFRRDVLVVTIRKSKTDQQGHGDQVSIPWGSHYITCPVRAIQDWVRAAGISSGPLFRGLTPAGLTMDGRITTRSISRIVKASAEQAGISGDISAHSLRSGFCTTAASKGKPYHEIQRQSRHKSMQTLVRYIRKSDLRNSPAADLGL